MRSSYFKLADKTDFSRFETTDLIYVDGPYVYATYQADVQSRLKLIPPHNFGPPERCYYEQTTNHPGFTVRQFGADRAIYIPWLPGQLFHRQGYLNTFQFAADLLAGIAGLKPVGLNLPPMVEVSWFEKEDKSAQLVHLVNSSGHVGISFFEPVPMANLTVELPLEQQPESVQSLTRKEPCDYGRSDGILRLHISQLGLFEAIQIL